MGNSEYSVVIKTKRKSLCLKQVCIYFGDEWEENSVNVIECNWWKDT